MYLLMKPRHKYLCISNEVLPIHSNYLHCIELQFKLYTLYRTAMDVRIAIANMNVKIKYACFNEYLLLYHKKNTFKC